MSFLCLLYRFIFGCSFLLLKIQASSLTTFQPNSLNIRIPTGQSNEKGEDKKRESFSTLHEAISLLQNHFIYRDRYRSNQWESFKQELSRYSESGEAIKELVKRLNEPYTRYIERTTMTDRRRSLTGVAISTGVTFKRQLHWEDLLFAARALFLPSIEFRHSFKLHLQYWSQQLTSKVFSKNSSASPSDRTIDLSLTPTLTTHQELLTDLLDYGKAYLSITLPPLLGMFSSHLKRSPWRSVLGLASITCLSLGLQSLPYLYPYEVSSLSPLGAASGIKEGDRLLSINGQKIQKISSRKLRRLLTSGEAGEKVYLQVIRKEELQQEFSSSSSCIGSAVNDTGVASLSFGDSHLHSITAHQRFSLLRPSSLHEKALEFFQRLAFSSWNNVTWPVLFLQHKNKKKTTVTYNLKLFEVIKDYIEESKLQFCLLSASPSAANDPPTTNGQPRKEIGYIHIQEFNDKTFDDFQEALETLTLQCQTQQQQQQLPQEGRLFSFTKRFYFNSRPTTPLPALVIDLRGNPGGPVSVALDIAALFLKKGSPLLQMSFQGKRETYYSKNTSPNQNTALLLLMDEQTASASEMLVEALCTNHRATSMGKKTVGKNFAQVILSLSDGSGLCFTVREFFAPDGRNMGGGHLPRIFTEEEIDIHRLGWNDSSQTWTSALPFPSSQSRSYRSLAPFPLSFSSLPQFW